MRKIKSLEVWNYFVAIIEQGGINAAADFLGVEPSTMSRAMHSLEQEIGASLWDRTTRPATLSVLGEEVYERAKVLLNEQSKLENFLFEDKNAMRGTIRICSQTGLGARALTENIVEFLKTYPDIHFELIDQTDDVVSILKGLGKQRADLFFGYEENMQEKGLKKFFCGSVPFIACASRSYIEEHGSPRTPADCTQHRGILVQSSVRNSTKELIRGGVTLPLNWKSTIIVPNPFAARHILRMGAGIMPDMSLFHADAFLTSGEWQLVMPGWQRPSLDAYIYVSESNYQKKRIRIFAEWLADRSREALHSLEVRYPYLY